MLHTNKSSVSEYFPLQVMCSIMRYVRGHFFVVAFFAAALLTAARLQGSVVFCLLVV